MFTATQRDQARYHGGKEIANRKRSLAQAATVIDHLRLDCEGRDSHMAGKLSQADIAILNRASAIVAGLTAELGREAKEADKIKATYDARCTAAQNALHRAHSATPENLIGLAALTRSWLLRDLLVDLDRGAHDVEYHLGEITQWLAHDYGKSDVALSDFLADIAARLPGAIAENANAIAKLNANLVQHRLERVAA